MKNIIRKIFDKYKYVRGDINLNNRAGMLHKCWGHVFSNHLFGDYIEFGVYQGDSFIESMKQFNQFKNWLESQKKSNEKWRIDVALQSPLNNKIYFHGLDTFEGMPNNNESDLIYKKNHFDSSYKKVLNRINNYNFKEFYLYKGLFKNEKNNLFKNLKNRKISIVNIDCDIHSSTKDSLEIIENFLQIGSIVLFDDYNAFNSDNSKGQRKALIEFQNKTNWIFEPFFTYMYSGKSFLIVGQKN